LLLRIFLVFFFSPRSRMVIKVQIMLSPPKAAQFEIRLLHLVKQFLSFLFRIPPKSSLDNFVAVAGVFVIGTVALAICFFSSGLVRVSCFSSRRRAAGCNSKASFSRFLGFVRFFPNFLRQASGSSTWN